jgi:hypothetical protein
VYEPAKTTHLRRELRIDRRDGMARTTPHL